MAINFRYLAWRAGLYTPNDKIELRVFQLKKKGASLQEVEAQIKEEFQLRFYGTDGQQIHPVKSRSSQEPPSGHQPEGVVEDPLAAARKDFSERLKSDPVLAAQMEAHRVETNEKTQARRAKAKKSDDGSNG